MTRLVTSPASLTSFNTLDGSFKTTLTRCLQSIRRRLRVPREAISHTQASPMLSTNSSSIQTLPRIDIESPDSDSLRPLDVDAGEINRTPEQDEGSTALSTTRSYGLPDPPARSGIATAEKRGDYCSFVKRIKECTTDLSETLSTAWNSLEDQNLDAMTNFAELKYQLVKLDTLCVKAERADDSAATRTQLLLCATNAAMALDATLNRVYGEDTKVQTPLDILAAEKIDCCAALQPSVTILQAILDSDLIACPTNPRAFALVCKPRLERR